MANKIWTTKDGRKVAVRDMTDEHLENTIRHLQRVARAKKISNDLFYMTCEAPESDGALTAFEQEADACFEEDWQDKVSPFFDVMMQEAERRGMKIEFKNSESADLRVLMRKLSSISKKRKQRRLQELEAEEVRLRKELDTIVNEGGDLL